MPFFAARCTLLVLSTLFYLPRVHANTEIVNFAAVEGTLAPSVLTANWTELSAKAPEKLLRVPPALLGTPLADVCQDSPGASCAHELGLTLRLDDPAWSAYSRFTLRISWSASSPADFDVQVKSAAALFSELRTSVPGRDVHSLPTGRRMYARIRVVDTGVRTPTADGSHERVPPDPITLMVLLEPLYFGVLPASVVPTVAFLILVIIVAALGIVPPVQRYLCAVADEAREETTSTRSKSD
ncbi:uncharacterized protein B0H18DRAFT_1118927 [Fomitopsis serialis]|uniref:uncharacterized protein n=1 Tax=Fomitopsis serialis TaxID=139415 RepID=UPI002008B646|nr:uncharacterized protein B0H18DRAFT_1118927 [Neoantrodia serialis]KAH9926428.1 hypothetical protein B0H18DRAFT_1118927 [Neoantrodia serialis]